MRVHDRNRSYAADKLDDQISALEVLASPSVGAAAPFGDPISG